MHARTLLFRVWGSYYLITGLWPVIHLPSFELITGAKTDDWLVDMVGLLAAVIGATLVRASFRDTGTDVQFLAISSALAFVAIDLWYVAAGIISPIYVAMPRWRSY
jgi:hypothetical protein